MRRELTPHRSDVGMLASVALAKLALHLVVSRRYGYSIDELYFLACGEGPYAHNASTRRNGPTCSTKMSTARRAGAALGSA